MKNKILLNVELRADGGGGFTAILRDSFGELFRTKRHASADGAKDAFFIWAADSMNLDRDQIKFTAF